MDLTPEATDTLLLLGGWLYVALQFGKGRVWSDAWTAYLAYVAPFVLAGVVVWGGQGAVTYVETAARLFLYATGFWAVTKVGAQPK